MSERTQPPSDPKLVAFGQPKIALKVRVYRAAENRWYELDEIRSWRKVLVERICSWLR